MMAMKIPDAFYQEAAENIAAIRRVNEPAVVVQDIERMLRSYVAAALAGRFERDFSDLLPEAEKTRIINATVAAGKSDFSINLSAARVFVNLQILEVLAARGQAAPNVAAPIEWNRRGVEYVAYAPVIKSPDLATATGNVISKFFSGMFGGGGMLPIAAVIAALVLLRRR